MIKYVIDYEHGVADFYTNEADPKKARDEFYGCAGICFGIRKSLGATVIKRTYKDVALPIPYRDKGATQFLSHGGDEILFDDRFRTHDGDPWKLMNEHTNWCSCKVKGVEELSCEVHHFWVPDHDKKCDCMKPKKEKK